MLPVTPQKRASEGPPRLVGLLIALQWVYGILVYVQIEAWNGLAGPKGMPKEAVDKLVDALNKALNDEGTKKRLLDLGTVLPTAEERTPAGFAALIKRDADKLTPALSAAPKQ